MMLRPSTIELNPVQAKAWQKALSQPLSEVNGCTIPQQFIFIEQLILSALANGEKCLVLTANPQQVDELNARLKAHQFDDLFVVQETSMPSKGACYEAIENQISKGKKVKSAAPPQFGSICDKLERSRERLNKVYQAVRNPVFGILTWPQLVGVFWETQPQFDQELLSIGLYQEGFAFTFEEYTALHQLVQQASPLYQKVQKLDHPLKQLNAQLFLQKDEATALRFCQEKLQAYQRRFETLIQQYNQHIETYGRLLRQHFEQHTQSFLTQTDQLLDQIDEQTTRYGARFLEAKLGKIKWYGPWLNRGKSAISAYKQIMQDYERLKSRFERLRWFTFSWPNPEKNKFIGSIKTVLQTFESALKNSHSELLKFVQEEQLRLNAKSMLPDLAPQPSITALEEEMEDLLAELNSTALLSYPLENKMLTLHKRKQYLEQVRLQLEQLAQSLADFAPFYSWQRFFLQQPGTAQNLLKTMAESRIPQWLPAFQNWYYHQVLLQLKPIDAPAKPILLREYHEWWTQYKAGLPAQIKYLWHQRRLALLPSFKKKNNSSVEGRTAQVEKPDWDVYTDFFPIQIMDQTEAIENLALVSVQLFDWVILLEPSSAVKASLTSYQALGKRVVIINSTESTPATDYLAAEGNQAFWGNFEQHIRPYFGVERLRRSAEINDLQVPLLLQPWHAETTGVVFLGDGFLSPLEACDYAWEYQQQQQLAQNGWAVFPVWSASAWQNLAAESRKIAAQIISLEKQKKQYE